MLISSTFPINNWSPFDKPNVSALTPNPPDTVQLGAGIGFSAILKEDGTVWTFGINDKGQLGLSDTLDRSQPTRINPSYFNNEKVIRMEVANNKVIVLTDNNKVYFWGNGATRPTLIYQDTLPILDVEVGGQDHNSHHIVKNNGTVASNGSNYHSTFGNGLSGYGSINTCSSSYTAGSTDFSRHALTSVAFEDCSSNPNFKSIVPGSEVVLTDIIDISRSGDKYYELALDIYNNLYIWGDGKPKVATLMPNPDFLVISKIEAAYYPTILTTDGRLFYYPNHTLSPVEITLENSTEKIIDIKGYGSNLLALGESGKLYALGPNDFGQLGSVIASSGANWNNKIALDTGITDVIRIGMGLGHSIIQKSDTKFYTMGRNSYGQLSTSDQNSKNTFMLNPNLTNVKDISTINLSSFAVTSDDKFYSWGGVGSGDRLGRAGDFNSPQIVKDFSTIGRVKELNGDGTSHVHGGLLLENGDYYNFGNSNWEIGMGRGGSISTPTALSNNNSSVSGNDFTLISAMQSGFTGVALSQDNRLYTWGYDSSNALGLGYTVTEIYLGMTETGGAYAFQEPVMPTNETFSKVYSGSYMKMALTIDGKVYAWGNNSYSKTGLSGGNRNIPTLVNTLPPIKDIAMGANHTLFLSTTGDVYAIGHNGYGQLGIGNTSSPSIPTKIPTLSNIIHIATGDNSSFAVSSTGETFSFGDNRYGQLGLGDTIQRNEPRLVPGVTDVKEIDGGLKHTMLITHSGSLYVTGSDGEGQLGLAQSQINAEPILVVFPPIVSISNAESNIYG